MLVETLSHPAFIWQKLASCNFDWLVENEEEGLYLLGNRIPKSKNLSHIAV